ncbi:MAG: VWA domain-containing protein [Methylovulum sp.]|nr:VWA domain-containing protein [Methylovulum sp.]
MRKRNQVFILVLLAMNSLPSQSEQLNNKHPALKDTEITEDLKQFSRQMVERKPLLREMLNQVGVEYLYQLDPKKIYRIDEHTLDVTVLGGEATASTLIPARIDFDANIYPSGNYINGWASTSVFCPNGGQAAEVSGIMSSKSRAQADPYPGGIKDGVLTTDTAILSKAEVNFSLVKAAGGAKNNGTMMQTVHIGSCDGKTDTAVHTHHWPPLKISMVIDDTGSMGGELIGVKSALTDFVNTRSSDPENITRGVSYELISFKDSPTLRLANTEDGSAAISAVNTLSASGGGDCPEDSLGALNLSLANIASDENSEGEIVLVTDASPRGGDVDAVIAQAQDLGVKVNVMLSGDCVASSAAAATPSAMTALTSPILSARDVFQRIANETGGLYFYKPSGTANDYKEILAEIFKTAATPSDTTPPVVTVNASPTTLWPPNHKMIRIDTNVSALDDQDPNPIIKLVGVTVNEPDDGQGDGNTAADIQITHDGQIYLRAERSGLGNGRFYTITYQATDKSGNVGFGTVDVIVPHNR